MLQLANRDTYTIPLVRERIIALADFALIEHRMGRTQAAEDSFLRATILVSDLYKPEHRIVTASTVARNLQTAGYASLGATSFNDAREAMSALPENSLARDLAVRQIVINEARSGLADESLSHAGDILDPYVAVPTLQAVALTLQSQGNLDKANVALQQARQTATQIENESLREKLVEKLMLAANE